MNTQVLYKLGFALTCISIIISFNSCKGKEKQNKECRAIYNKAKSFLDAYYLKKDSTLLYKSLAGIEQALKCEEIKPMAAEMKISLLVLLKEYRKGYKFIDSLNVSDFSVSYKKSMYHDFLLALEHESKQDTVGRNNLYNKIISDIQKYLEKENKPGSKINEEGYYLLFTFKSKFLSYQQVKSEIESLKQQYPDSHAFLDVLIENFKNESKTSSLIPVD